MTKLAHGSHSIDNKRLSVEDVAIWLEEHGDVLFRYACARVRDPQIAEDLVQDAILSAIKATESFRGESTLQTWLIGILKNKIIDRFRRDSRRNALEVLDISDEGSDSFEERNFNRLGIWNHFLQDWAATPHELLEEQQLQVVFEKCLNNLSAKSRRVFVLKTLEQIDTEQICNDLEISSSNLWVMLHRARNELRECIEASWNRD